VKKFVSTIIIIFVIIVGIVVAGPFFVVHEGEQAILVRFGALVGEGEDAVRRPGLRLKAPFIDQVVRYPTRIMTWDGEARSMPTREMQFIFVDVTARWRIVNPVLFYTSLTTLDAGHHKLSEIIDSAVRTVVARNYLHEMVRDTDFIIGRDIEPTDVLGLGDGVDGVDVAVIAAVIQTETQHRSVEYGRRMLTEEVLALASPIAMDEYGIEIIDVVTRQVRYTDELTLSVYARMIRERGQIAQLFRSTGEGQMASWLGRTELESRQILSEAYERAEAIRGAADAEAARIFAEAYMQNQSFFEFWRAIESYRITLPGFNAMLSTDMEYFRFLFSPTN